MRGRLNPTRRRLLLLVDGLDDRSGGGERTVVTIATHLPADRYEVWVATGRHAGGEPIRRLAAAGIHHVHLDRRGRIGLRGLRRLGALIRHERIEVLHAHKFGSNLWGTLVGRLAGVPVVVAHEHSWPYAGQPARRALDHLIGRAADAFVAVSEADRRLMVSFERVPEVKTRVIPSAWVPGPAAEGDVRAELGIAPDAPVVGTVAVMRPVKRLELLVEAFAAIAAAVPAARLVLAGDGDCRPGLEAQAQALGVGDRVHFLGMRQDVPAVWRAIDVGVICSEREGSPVAAMEAMAAGVPMVATEVGGMAEVVQPGRTGLLVASGSAEALASALRELLDDPPRREAMGAAAAARAGDFTAERQAERCAALYEELLEG
jgi:glycosyltransferase involved in cell wall biosynthesis